MIPHSFKTEGIILGKRDFSEADRILDIYSKDMGKISLMAKGVRRIGSRKRGHVEIFSKISFQAVNGKGIPILTEVETIDDYKGIRKSIKKISLAYYFVEVAAKLTREGGENIEFYNYLSNILERLKFARELKKLRFEFVANTLKILGYWPEDKILPYPDEKLEEVMERQIYSKRVGKKILSNIE